MDWNPQFKDGWGRIWEEIREGKLYQNTAYGKKFNKKVKGGGEEGEVDCENDKDDGRHFNNKAGERSLLKKANLIP